MDDTTIYIIATMLFVVGLWVLLNNKLKSLAVQNKEIDQKARDLLEKREEMDNANFFISVMPQFYQFDQSGLFEMYNTIDKQPHIDHKINRTVEISGGIDVKPLKLGLKNSSTVERKKNPPTKKEKYIICLIYFANEEKIVTDLEHLVLEDNSLDKFDRFLSLANEYGIDLNQDKVDLVKKDLRNTVVKSIIDKKNIDSDSPCLLQNCEFTILQNNIGGVELVSIHPISSYLEEGKDIKIIINIDDSTLTDMGKSFFLRNKDKSVRFTVFGKMKRVYDEKMMTLEIQISPYAIT